MAIPRKIFINYFTQMFIIQKCFITLYIQKLPKSFIIHKRCPKVLLYTKVAKFFYYTQKIYYTQKLHKSVNIHKSFIMPKRFIICKLYLQRYNTQMDLRNVNTRKRMFYMVISYLQDTRVSLVPSYLTGHCTLWSHLSRSYGEPACIRGYTHATAYYQLGKDFQDNVHSVMAQAPDILNK